MKVVFATPTVERPHDAYLKAMEDSLPALDAAGIEHSIVFEVGNPYISNARATLLRKALDTKPDCVVFLDHDVSWRPEDMVRLIEAPYEVVAGTYRFKLDEEEYMGRWATDEHGNIAEANDHGCIRANCVPAGFLKVTTEAIERFMRAYPKLVYGTPVAPHVDLFNHGAFGGVWFGEDYAFCRNWNDLGGKVWLMTDLNIGHHSKDKEYPGNLHNYLIRKAQEARQDA